MPRGTTYANNSYNRSMGRVGAPMGSMSVSRSSSASSGASSSGSSYVDNSYNRSVGRVGAPLGSMPVSRSSSASLGSSSGGTYVDNAYNRSVGRVGAAMGSMPVSKSSSDDSPSGKTYVDNSYNRSVGRVGMPVGSMVMSKSSSTDRPTSSSTGEGILMPSLPEVSDGAVKVYKDNAFNRRLGRVGLPLGSAPHSRKSASSEERFYVDNQMNRELGRVGMKVGSAPVSKTTSKNPKKHTQPTHPMNEMLEELLQEPEADIMGDFSPGIPPEEQEYMHETVLSLIRRMNQVLKWQESSKTEGKQPQTSISKLKYEGPVIRFDEIELGVKIGHGGFGDVFFAKWQGQVCAVKKLRVQRVSQRRLKQFEEEVGVLNRLDHFNVVKFLGACVVTPNLAIVMEYMQKSLFDALHVEELAFSSEQQFQIILHMAEGLGYLHEKSVAHCDIKSTNILLNLEDGVVAKISDFGLSMMKSEAETSQSTAKVVQGAGTPKYSAPEVLSGEELNLTAMCKADVYSMSLVAWEVVCQEMPFYGLNIHQLKRRVQGGDVNLEIPADITVGERFLDLLKLCWKQNASKRPSSKFFKESLLLNGIV